MLRRWTAYHDHWLEEVGSVAVDTDDGLVFVDPLEPPPELGRPEHVLLTIYWHDRGTKELGASQAPLRPLLELPVEQVLVSHGEPVLSDGRRLLDRLVG